MKTDGKAIGRGAYKILEEKGDDCIVAFGMAPKWLMDMIERQLKDKIAAIQAEKMECEDDPVWVEKLRNAIDPRYVNKVMHDVFLGLLDAAKDANKLLV